MPLSPPKTNYINGIFYLGPDSTLSAPYMEKIEMAITDLRTMKQILHDTDNLTGARWLQTTIFLAEAGPSPKFRENKLVLECFLGNIKRFKPFFYERRLTEYWSNTNPSHPSWV